MGALEVGLPYTVHDKVLGDDREDTLDIPDAVGVLPEVHTGTHAAGIPAEEADVLEGDNRALGDRLVMEAVRIGVVGAAPNREVAHQTRYPSAMVPSDLPWAWGLDRALGLAVRPYLGWADWTAETEAVGLTFRHTLPSRSSPSEKWNKMFFVVIMWSFKAIMNKTYHLASLIGQTH